MEKAVIDTNVFVNFFLKTDLTERAKDMIKLVLTDYSPVVFTNILEETTFILIREELAHKGILKFYDQRDFIEKNGYVSLFVYKKFFEFLKKFSILILENKCNVDDFQSIMEKYNLLPNDALIAATCKHYGIKKIATFDGDFKRVEFLEVLEV
ncbi:MAG TPA: PIN domain-containing protein [Candidatus Altiarchaeales archaeon]|nr:MAG: hypothetical protein DRN47_06340 [Candidatus Wolframiiraptor sp.]HDN83554.1 PIN domain-containing protein [Candidatus Altiarchaeales archaeon]